jgi:hypothetical protein
MGAETIKTETKGKRLGLDKHETIFIEGPRIVDRLLFVYPTYIPGQVEQARLGIKLRLLKGNRGKVISSHQEEDSTQDS